MPPFAHSLAWAIIAALPPFARFGDWRCSQRAFARISHYRHSSRAFYWRAPFIGDRCCTLCGHRLICGHCHICGRTPPHPSRTLTALFVGEHRRLLSVQLLSALFSPLLTRLSIARSRRFLCSFHALYPYILLCARRRSLACTARTIFAGGDGCNVAQLLRCCTATTVRQTRVSLPVIERSGSPTGKKSLPHSLANVDLLPPSEKAECDHDHSHVTT